MGGFIASSLIYWASPVSFNLIILFSYFIIFGLKQVIFKQKVFGRIYNKETGKPIPFVKIKIFFQSLPGQQVASCVSDITGKYYILVVGKGEYIMNLQAETLEGREINTSLAVKTSDKIINFDLRV